MNDETGMVVSGSLSESEETWLKSPRCRRYNEAVKEGTILASEQACGVRKRSICPEIGSEKGERITTLPCNAI